MLVDRPRRKTCSTCKHWAGARLCNHLDEKGKCLELSKAKNGKTKWIISDNGDTCPSYERFTPFDVVEGKVRMTIETEALRAEGRVYGLTDYQDIMRVISSCNFRREEGYIWMRQVT